MNINKQNSPFFALGQAKWDKFVHEYEGPYDFSGSVYAGMNQKVRFTCPAHGEVTSDAKNLISGKRCNACAIAARAGGRRMTQKQMLGRFVEVHGETYNYDHAVYAGQTKPVTIRCSRHGDFLQKPEFHWGGSGCPTCFHEDRRGASQRDTLESFTEKLEGVFPGGFTVCGGYEGSQALIGLTCTVHSEVVHTKPNYILNGHNPCPKCNHMKSAPEEEVAAYLSIFTTVERRSRTLIGPKEVDIYLPEHKIAVEFCGMYWHSHGDKVDETKNKARHATKHRLCAAKGVRLITIYETEWTERPAAIKRLLRNAIGKTRGRLMARKCEVRKPTAQEARSFYEKYHPQGGAGSGEHWGLYWKGALVACMRFTFGGNDRGAAAAGRVWTLSRYATRVSVSGAASKLFTVFLKEKTPGEVKSFSDNRLFSGGMYSQLGFTLEADLPPDYQVWSTTLGLRPKAHYQRRLLATRLREHGVVESFDPAKDTRTEATMTYLMGGRRIFDCGKKRWVWRAE
jgi:hypothetical protein